MTAAVIGTGFLGEQLYIDSLSVYDEVVSTYHKNKKYPDSKSFDFFEDDIKDVFGDRKIDTIFLSAKIEFEENEEGLKNAMIRFLKTCANSRIIYISSDGIFDGKHGMYKEDDIPCPITPYGKNLKVCEELVKTHSKNFCIIRPSYLYGFVNGRLDGRFSSVKREIEEGKTVARFTDMFKSPLSYKEASEAIIKFAISDYRGIVHVCGRRMSVYDLTREGMAALGIPTDQLVRDSIPGNRTLEFLPDTSLDNTLMVRLTGMRPLGIANGFMIR